MVLAGLGFELVALMAVAVGLGRSLDGTFDAKGYITLALIGIAILGWLIHLLVIVGRIAKDLDS